MTYYFDMDGTLDNLKGVEDVWKRLDAGDTTVYYEAAPIPKYVDLIKQLKQEGNRVGIITWLSRSYPDPAQQPLIDAQTIEYKKKWLEDQGIVVDEFKAIKYGTSKYEAADDKAGSVLIDDDDKALNTWFGDRYKAIP